MAGIICSVLGLVVIYGLSENLAGAIILIIGCALSLVSLPTFIMISLFNSAKQEQK